MTQRETVLRMLREAGAKGVSAVVFNYEWGITRSAAIVHDLRGEGFNIETKDDGKMHDGRQRLARYVLHADAGVSQSTPTPVREAKVQDAEVTRTAIALAFGCGCVRSADGLGWASRCGRHVA